MLYKYKMCANDEIRMLKATNAQLLVALEAAKHELELITNEVYGGRERHPMRIICAAIAAAKE